MKATAQTVIIWLFLLFVTGESLNLYFKANSKANRMEENLKAVNQQAEEFKAKNGQQASRLTSQELTIQELRRINPQIIAQLKNLYIPPRLAQSYSQTTQTIQAEVPVIPRDSIVYRTVNDTVPVLILKVWSYQDKWIKIRSELGDTSGKTKVAAIDSIFTAIYRGERRHPAWWFLSKRKLQVAATNRSPYIKIQVIQAGVIKR